MWLCRCGTENGDSSHFCLNCGLTRSVGEYSAEKEKIIKEIQEKERSEREQIERKREEERKRKLFEEEQERKRREQEDRDAFLKENGHEGYYEYKVISLTDNHSGSLDIGELSNLLNSLGRDGWHLKCAYANELGHNSTSGGVGGFSTGTNSTVDQNILILERFIKFK